jgi:hypothetical protein
MLTDCACHTRSGRRNEAARMGQNVNLTSIAALGTSMAGTTFYASTKAAVIVLTRRFALDLGPHGITVNAIVPGFSMTDMAGNTTGDAMAAIAMMPQVGKPNDISSAASFRVSHESLLPRREYGTTSTDDNCGDDDTFLWAGSPVTIQIGVDLIGCGHRGINGLSKGALEFRHRRGLSSAAYATSGGSIERRLQAMKSAR